MNSFLQGKTPAPAPSLFPPSAPVATPFAARVRAAQPATPGTNVEVIKEGDKVVRLVITCACGERTEVECIYPAGS
jgi:hypothetical protein